MSVKPIKGWIIIKPAEAEATTKGGIALPQTARTKQSKGEVVAIGKSVKGVKVGQVVFFKRWEVNELKWQDENYLLAKIEDILAIDEQANKRAK